MSTKTNETITAADWLDVRDKIASEIQPVTSVQASTRIAIAERLLRKGFIDIDEVHRVLHPQPEPTTGSEVSE